MQRLVHQLHTDPHIALEGGERRRGEERREEGEQREKIRGRRGGGGEEEEERRERKEREEEERNMLVSLTLTIMVVMYESDVIPPSLNTVMQLKYKME